MPGQRPSTDRQVKVQCKFSYRMPPEPYTLFNGEETQFNFLPCSVRYFLHTQNVNIGKVFSINILKIIPEPDPDTGLRNKSRYQPYFVANWFNKDGTTVANRQIRKGIWTVAPITDLIEWDYIERCSEDFEPDNPRLPPPPPDISLPRPEPAPEADPEVAIVNVQAAPASDPDVAIVGEHFRPLGAGRGSRRRPARGRESHVSHRSYSLPGAAFNSLASRHPYERILRAGLFARAIEGDLPPFIQRL